MTWLGYKVLPLSRLVKPGTWKVLITEPRIAELAANIGEVGLVHAPVVRKGTMGIVSGLDRVAAHHVAGLKDIEVRLWDGTDAELKRVRVSENYQRRQFSEADRKVMRDEYAAAADGIFGNAEKSQPPDITDDEARQGKRGRGRPRSARRDLIRQVAAAAGASERTAGRAVAETEEPPAVPAWGDDVETLRHALAAVSASLVSAQARLTKAYTHLPKELAEHARLHELHRVIKHAAAQVRQAEPATVCYYCKAHPEHLPGCPGCKGHGYLVRAQIADVPPELLAQGDDAGIYIAGTFTRMVDL